MLQGHSTNYAAQNKTLHYTTSPLRFLTYTLAALYNLLVRLLEWNCIRSRTVQPVVSRYTDWATRPTIFLCRKMKSMPATLQTTSITVVNLQDNRAVFRICIALLGVSCYSPSYVPQIYLSMRSTKMHWHLTMEFKHRKVVLLLITALQQMDAQMERREVRLHSFLTSRLAGSMWSASWPDRITPWPHSRSQGCTSYKNSVSTCQRTQSFSFTKAKLLMSTWT